VTDGMNVTVPLSLLGLYRHVVWYTDPTGATYGSSWDDKSTPITALRLVNSPGKPVILSTYMSQGLGRNGGFVASSQATAASRSARDAPASSASALTGP